MKKSQFIALLTIFAVCFQFANAQPNQQYQLTPNYGNSQMQQQVPNAPNQQIQQQGNANMPAYETPEAEHSVPTIKRDEKKEREGSTVQVAILLDTSNSMDGLIDQAKSQLWKMVNELALARDKDGNIPNIEIALYEYGNDNLSALEGYIRQVVPLSTDLDLISEKLFGLSTNGGNEYCGQVIHTSTKQLDWTNSNDDLKMIFIAGNEPFTQGNVDYAGAVQKRHFGSIIVNTIFCGDYQNGINTKWKDGADLADGKYMNIDQNDKVVHIDAPQDKEINRLNGELNDTYIGYGHYGFERKKMQNTQDMNAAGYGAANTSQRAVSKASSNYKNADWDLVDAVEDESVDLNEISDDQLPEEMKKMDKKERKEYIDKKAEKRCRNSKTHPPTQQRTPQICSRIPKKAIRKHHFG